MCLEYSELGIQVNTKVMRPTGQSLDGRNIHQEENLPLLRRAIRHNMLYMLPVIILSVSNALI